MNFTTLLGQVGISLLTVLPAFWLGTQIFAKAWLKGRFDKEVERLKAENNRELEALRYQQARGLEHVRLEIAQSLDRTAKLHQHEFEVLPEIWDRLTKALSATAATVSRLQSYPATDRMGDGEFNEFLEKVDLLQWEKAELRARSPKNRDETLHKMLKWQRLREAMKLHGEFHNYFISRAIFLNRELRESLRELSNMNYDALHECQLDLEVEGQAGKDRFNQRDRFNKEWVPKMNEIQDMVEARLSANRIAI